MAIGEKNAVTMAVKSPEAGNLPVLTADGQLQDSGLTPSAAGVRPNLLINPWLIDQRGKQTYAGTVYGPDCIRGTANVTKTLHSDGSLTCSSNSTNSISVIFLSLLSESSYELLAGRTFTFSFLTTEGILRSITGTIPEEKPSNNIIVNQSKDSVGIGILFNGAQGLVGQIYTPNSSVTIVPGGVKLEEGDAQTLARQQNDRWELLETRCNRAAELLKCQRYYFETDLRDSGYTRANGSLADVVVYLPTTMRTTPVIISEINDLVIRGDGIDLINGAFSVSTLKGNKLMCYAKPQSGQTLIARSTVAVYSMSNIKLKLSAEL